MKNKLLVISLAFAGLLVTACGDGGSVSSSVPTSSPTSEPTNTPTSEPTSEPSSEPTSEPSTSSPAGKVNYYKITFIDEEGNVLADRKWPEGSVPYYNYQKASTKENLYDVLGWSTVADGDVIDIPEVIAEATYYAIVQATKRMYTIWFDPRGGSYVEPIKGGYGDVIETEPESGRNIYYLDGWYMNDERVSFPYTITGNATMIAHWEKVM